MASCHTSSVGKTAALIHYAKISRYHNQRQSRTSSVPKSCYLNIPKSATALVGVGGERLQSDFCKGAPFINEGADNLPPPSLMLDGRSIGQHLPSLNSGNRLYPTSAFSRLSAKGSWKSRSSALRIAPILIRKSSAGLHLHCSTCDHGKVNCSSGKGGESSSCSWRLDCLEKVIQESSGSLGHWNSYTLTRINNKYIGIGGLTMSMSLLLDPIIGSPPSSLTSPSVEARDDISALSDGFKRKVTMFRRKLSTSFDEPSNYGREGRLFSEDSDKDIEHAGPFGFRGYASGGGGDASRKEDIAEDNRDKKMQINAWLAKLHEEAILRSRDESTERSSASDGESEGPADNQDDGSSSKSRPPIKVTEDLFQLLEKVIGFKGRNISHITVEQSVKDLCTVYLDAGDEDKLKFFTVLAEKHGVDHDVVTATATNLMSCKDGDVRLTLEEKLRGALVPKSQWLFTQIGRLENGVKFLVDLRTDLLDAIEKSPGNLSSLKALNNSLRDLIGMWFNVGFLGLERVTWQSSCDMLQKISEYEAVHPMRNWTDLKKRVGPNRRCFVYTHNSMPSEPVVVLHTFLTDHIPSSIQKIVANHRMRMMSLDSDLPLASNTEDPDFINTAVFYSITSTQRGLTGIELGNYLIKRVVRELQSEFPKMTQYSSLSPIPGFKNWLVSSIKNMTKESAKDNLLLTEQEIECLRPMFKSYSSDKDFYQVFLDLLKVNTWHSDDKLVKEMEKPLMRLCAKYLYLVKRRGYALDPVAHFHLKNGAVMWRINWLGDTSPRGLGQSCGIMVNYRYFLDVCETNSQNYMENQVIKLSDQVNHFVKLTDS